jgi:peptide methionine sulfoxide reductase MsrA
MSRHGLNLPPSGARARQRSEIFCTSARQRQVAEETVAAADASGLWHGKVVTRVSDAGPFREAGAGDQDYLRHYPAGRNQFSPGPPAAGQRGPGRGGRGLS